MNVERIVPLDHTSLEVADAIRAVMFKGYSVEAALLDAVDFVPLRRTTAEIAEAQACFIGIWAGRDLVAVAELEETSPGICQISSLVVDPARFREGLAAALARHIIETHPGDDLEVSTGCRNLPALRLYASHGFRESSRWTTGDGVAMVTLVRGAKQDDQRARPRRRT